MAKGKNSKRNIVRITNKQARTKKYDSKIEKIIARVARQEDEKHIIKLIYRQYILGAYAITTNVFLAGTKIDFEGLIAPIAQIQLIDNVTMPTVIPAVNALQFPSTWQNPGVNVIASNKPYDGFRRGTTIYLHALNIDLRVKIAMIGAITPLFENSTLKYKVILAQYFDSDLSDSVPDIDEVKHMFRLFGKSTKLDDAEYKDSKDFKIRTLFTGSINTRLSLDKTSVKFKSHYIKFQRKIMIEYLDGDQSGRRIIRWKPFIVFESQIPTGAGYDIYKPEVHCCTKLYYSDT